MPRKRKEEIKKIKGENMEETVKAIARAGGIAIFFTVMAKVAIALIAYAMAI